MQTQSIRQAFRIAMIYITVAAVWNWASRVLLKRFVSEGLNIDRLMDWGFTIIMGGLLYRLVRQLLRQWEKERKASEMISGALSWR
jgi:hypothetical protein